MREPLDVLRNVMEALDDLRAGPEWVVLHRYGWERLRLLHDEIREMLAKEVEVRK